MAGAKFATDGRIMHSPGPYLQPNNNNGAADLNKVGSAHVVTMAAGGSFSSALADTLAKINLS
jgi:hypothetical protein